MLTYEHIEHEVNGEPSLSTSVSSLRKQRYVTIFVRYVLYETIKITSVNITTNDFLQFYLKISLSFVKVS